MTPNPFTSLLHSRKFWLAIFSTVVSIVLYFSSKYADPSLADDIKFVIGAITLQVTALIGAIAYEDAAIVKAQAAQPPKQ